MENIPSILQNLDLELQRIRLLYLKWALERFNPPTQDFAGMKAGDSFPLIDSPYGRAFQVSPCGRGYCYLGSGKGNCRPPKGMWSEDKCLERDTCATKDRLTEILHELRGALRELFKAEKYGEVWGTLQDYWWLKLGTHELAYDGDLGEPPDHKEKNPVRRQLIESIHRGMDLSEQRPQKVPERDILRFLSYNLRWDRYAICSYDCGPITISKGTFVRFSDLAQEIASLCAELSNADVEERKTRVKEALKKHYELLCYDDEIPAKTHGKFQLRRPEIRKTIDRVEACLKKRQEALQKVALAK